MSTAQLLQRRPSGAGRKPSQSPLQPGQAGHGGHPARAGARDASSHVDVPDASGGKNYTRIFFPFNLFWNLIFFDFDSNMYSIFLLLM